MAEHSITNPDLIHLGGGGGHPFLFSLAHLARLAQSARYPLAEERILFGIRGAIAPRDLLGRWVKTIELTPKSPDGLNLHCLIGIWSKSMGKMVLFPASTHPNQKEIERQFANREARIANRLTQGFYQYRVGAHEPETRPFEEGAFRMSRAEPVLVWRVGDQPIFDESSRLDLCRPNDHIHSAQTEHPERTMSYASAGCQVIEGEQMGDRITGFYQAFRLLAGQAAFPDPLEVGRPFKYLLTTFEHLFAIASGWEEVRLLYGSQSYGVRLLQEALMREGFLEETTIDKGLFNGATGLALAQYQEAQGVKGDGIATPYWLKRLGLPLDHYAL